MRPSLFAMIVACLLANLLGASLAQDEARTKKGEYPVERFFAFGWWALEVRPYQTGLEDTLRDMRRLYMNCVLSGPRCDSEADLPRFLKEVALCRRYEVYSVPSSGRMSPSQLRMVAAKLKDEDGILGWYIRDEPNPDFLPDFVEYQNALAEVAPRQPALCLFYRPDSAQVFAPHQPILLTDCYPMTYSHNGTSLGPHFAIGSEQPLGLADDLGRFNPYGRRGVLEWMDLCRTLTGGLPHWITLQAFESGNSHTVRWRDPTTPELRLQTYLAVAGGAKGIFYFRFFCVSDDYGNPLPSAHGERTPLMKEIARLGRELTPLGPVLADAEAAEPLTIVAAYRPSFDPGDRIEARRLRSKTRDVDYLVVFNNNVQVQSRAEIQLDRRFLRGRGVYNLHQLQAAQTREFPGAVILPVRLPPGGGRIYSIASGADFLTDEKTIRRERCENEARSFRIDYELAVKSGLSLQEVDALRKQYETKLAAGDYASAESLIRRCARRLRATMKADPQFRAAQQDLAYVRETLGKLSGDPPQFNNRLSNALKRLRALFWEGKAKDIRPAAAKLRAIVETIEAAAPEGQTALSSVPVDEDVLREIEGVE